jgi:hypothetical protein
MDVKEHFCFVTLVISQSNLAQHAGADGARAEAARDQLDDPRNLKRVPALSPAVEELEETARLHLCCTIILRILTPEQITELRVALPS